MKFLGVSLLLAIALAPAARTQQAPDVVPWSIVHSTEESPWNNIDWIDLVALSKDSLVACYQRSGGRVGFGGTFVLRSRDGGRSWQIVQSLNDFHSASLVWDGTHVWLIGLFGDGGKSGQPAVSRALDAEVTGFRTPAPVRGSELLKSAATSIVQGGRVWRLFRRGMIDTCSKIQEQILVASALIGTDLEEPASWHWSGEVPSDCAGAEGYGSPMRFVDDGTPILHFLVEPWDELSPKSVIGVQNEGWTLKVARPAPAWGSLPRGADRFQRNSPDGAFYAVGVDTTHVGVDRDDLPMNVVTAVRSGDLRDWRTSVVLHDARETPLHFAAGIVRALPDGELGMLFTLRTNMKRDVHASFKAPTTLVFLRVPRIADRLASDPPLWGPPVPR